MTDQDNTLTPGAIEQLKDAAALLEIDPEEPTAEKPFTGRMYNGNIAFLTATIEDARSIEAAADIMTGAAALDTFKGIDLVNTLAEWNGPAGQDGNGIIIICLNNSAESRRRSEELKRNIYEMHTRCIIWNLCGECITPHEAAAADPERFADEIKAALKAAEAARDLDDLDDFLERIQQRTYEYHATGLDFFDSLFNGGIINGTILSLLAAPAAGKTTLSQQIAEAMAEKGTPVLYLNLEMSSDQMLSKTISRRLAARGVKLTTMQVLQGYNWSDREARAIKETTDEYRAAVYKNIKYKPAEVTTDLDSLLSYLHDAGEKARAAGKPAPAVFLDYLHLVTTKRSIDVKNLIQETVYGLKQYAIDYNTFVFIISAISRTEMKEGQLSMTSGRDSSNIEFSADYVLTLNYMDYEAGAADPTKKQDRQRVENEIPRRMILSVEKNRFGKKCKAGVNFDPAANLFKPSPGFIPADNDEQLKFDTSPKPKKRL